MPRVQKPDAPHPVMLRLTAEAYAVLSAAAFLRSVTPTELARMCVTDFVEREQADDRVMRVMTERAAHEAEERGTVRGIGASKREGGKKP